MFIYPNFVEYSLFLQAILGMIGAVSGLNFFIKCYLPLGDLMDVMALGNSTINFIVYYMMSKQFRKAFLDMCCCEGRCCPRACHRRSDEVNANNNDVGSYDGERWKCLGMSKNL